MARCGGGSMSGDSVRRAAAPLHAMHADSAQRPSPASLGAGGGPRPPLLARSQPGGGAGPYYSSGSSYHTSAGGTVVDAGTAAPAVLPDPASATDPRQRVVAMMAAAKARAEAQAGAGGAPVAAAAASLRR